MRIDLAMEMAQEYSTRYEKSTVHYEIDHYKALKKARSFTRMEDLSQYPKRMKIIVYVQGR